jgi:NTE family protein
VLPYPHLTKIDGESTAAKSETSYRSNFMVGVPAFENFPDQRARDDAKGDFSPRRSGPTTNSTKTVNLALQGGGTHGAFAWGVLDKLLEDGRIEIEGISATSAGAMNAAVLAYGFSQGGSAGARKALDGFWRRVADAAAIAPLQPSFLDRILQNHALSFTPAFLLFDLMTRLMSPYQFNPLNINPLRHVLEQSVDFDRLKRSTAIKIFLSATNVRTGKIKVFKDAEISPDAVLASACLPLIFQAVEIDGEAYWDGGYMGNPALFPLIYECRSADVVVVHINPLARAQVPKSAQDILNRINEISFNSSLMREMRAVAFVNRLIDEGTISDIFNGRMKRMLLHSIAADEFMQSLGVASKFNADWRFLTQLREIGRERAAAWLATSFGLLGEVSTVEMSTYL